MSTDVSALVFGPPTPASITVAAIVVGLLATLTMLLIRNERRVNQDRIGGVLDFTGVSTEALATGPDLMDVDDWFGGCLDLDWHPGYRDARPEGEAA